MAPQPALPLEVQEGGAERKLRRHLAWPAPHTGSSAPTLQAEAVVIADPHAAHIIGLLQQEDRVACLPQVLGCLEPSDPCTDNQQLADSRARAPRRPAASGRGAAALLSAVHRALAPALQSHRPLSTRRCMKLDGRGGLQQH